MILRRAVIVPALAIPLWCANAPGFEAASIKPSAGPPGSEGGNRSRIEYTPNSLTMRNVDLAACIEWGYGVAHYQVLGTHLNSESYDILAKVADPVPVSQLRLMLRDLLAKRFKLALHRETKMLPVYEMTVAKSGAKLPPPNPDNVLPAAAHAAESLPRIRGGNFLFDDASMAEFAQKLSQLNGIDLPVVDHTGIKGTFDIVLKTAATVATQGETSTLLAIVRDQLGLELSASKAATEVLVVDRAERPTAN